MATFTAHKDKLVECPFDKNHKIAVRNQIKHIIECEQKVVSKFSVCIYNATHRMARHEFAKHINNCPDGRQYVREVYASKQTNSADSHQEITSLNSSSVKSQITSNTQTNEESDEDNTDNWDNDNCPHYSIYDSKPVNTNDNIPAISGAKLSKNQKKRNRKKTANASKQSNSVWD